MSILKNKAVKVIPFLIFIFSIIEITIRISGVYKTYSEKNFDRYESLYNKESDTYYYQTRRDTVIYSQTEFQFVCPVNKLGLRDNTPLIPDTNKTNKILFLGDSFTEGVGASCGNTMPDMFRYFSMQQATTVNAGVVGSDPFYQTLWYNNSFHLYNPDEIILVMNASDISDFIFRGGKERFVSDSLTQSKNGPRLEFFYKHSHIVRLFTHLIMGYDFTLISGKEHKLATQKALEVYAEHLNAWAKNMEEKNVSVVVHPYAFSYAKHVPGHDALPEIGALLDTTIRFINLYPAFNEVLNEENYLDYSWELDGHFNDQGYALFADLLWNEWRKSSTKDF